MFSRLTIENFTVFKKLSLDLSPGVNVFVGDNGTGKTHLLKLLYCLRYVTLKDDWLHEKLTTVFRPMNGDTRRLVKKHHGDAGANITATWNSEAMDVSIVNTPNMIIASKVFWSGEIPVYIPVKEMLSLASGFIPLYDRYQIAFDEVYYDILKMAYIPLLKEPLSEEFNQILAEIQEVINGEVVVEGDVFYLRQDEHALEMHLVAEGHRKLALLWQLIRNGSLHSGTTLFWDEPEANLNPSVMPRVARILLLLAQQGVQVFVATHHYAFLKELDYQKENTPVTFFALDKDGADGVQAKACQNYREITPNRIADEYIRLYDLEIKRKLGR